MQGWRCRMKGLRSSRERSTRSGAVIPGTAWTALRTTWSGTTPPREAIINTSRAGSSDGQSSGLIIRSSIVQVQPGPSHWHAGCGPASRSALGGVVSKMGRTGMDNHLLTILKVELLSQAELAQVAGEQLDAARMKKLEGRMRRDDEFWVALQSILTIAGNASKLLWGSWGNEATAARRQPLRELVGVRTTPRCARGMCATPLSTSTMRSRRGIAPATSTSTPPGRSAPTRSTHRRIHGSAACRPPDPGRDLSEVVGVDPRPPGRA